MTVKHVLTRCLNLATLREEIGPNGTEVQEQRIVWQPGAAPPDEYITEGGTLLRRTVHQRMQKKRNKLRTEVLKIRPMKLDYMVIVNQFLTFL
jgi:hypothetical protein